MIRLLIADDSALMRKLLEGIFLAEGDFDIRLARNGNEALELVHAFDPQIVTLDVQMPGMDGLTCLSRIMIEAPRPVVMISSLTAEGAEATLEAIKLGAVDFIAKPSGAVSLEIDRLRPLVVEKVRAAASARIRRTLRLTERVRHQIRRAGLVSRPRPSRASPLQSAKIKKGGMKLGNGDLPGLRADRHLDRRPGRAGYCAAATTAGLSVAEYWSPSICRRVSPAPLPKDLTGNAISMSLRSTNRCP